MQPEQACYDQSNKIIRKSNLMALVSPRRTFRSSLGSKNRIVADSSVGLSSTDDLIITETELALMPKAALQSANQEVGFGVYKFN
jgi:hypothetical protein